MKHDHAHNHDHTLVKTFTVTKGAKSTVKITGEIPFEQLQKHRAAVLADMGKDVELKGFRKGHVPETMLMKHLGEMAILQEMANHALSEHYPHILEEYSLDAIGRPNIQVTKLAPENPFGFTIDLSVIPEINLPDYKKAAAEVNTTRAVVTITEKDITEAIERIQRQKLSYDRIQEKAKKKAAQDAAVKDGLSLPTPETVETDTEEDISKLPVPELTDDYVKTLGAFADVAAFKKQITEHLTQEKNNEAASKHRAALIDALVEKSTIELPDILVQSELGQMFAQMEDDLKRANLTLDGYLEHVKKTKEDMVKEWTPSAEKRAKTQLILNELARKEAITLNEDEVVKQTAQLMTQYKDADPMRVRIYIESMMRNDAVMKFLEEQK